MSPTCPLNEGGALVGHACCPSDTTEEEGACGPAGHVQMDATPTHDLDERIGACNSIQLCKCFVQLLITFI